MHCRRLLVIVLLLLGLTSAAPARAAPGEAGACDPGRLGACFDTLPVALPGPPPAWSQLIVGEHLLLTGRVAPPAFFGGPARGLQLRTPGGRTLPLALDQETFRQLVAFDEEGTYTLERVATDDSLRPLLSCAVAYHTIPLDSVPAPLLFGPNHPEQPWQTLALSLGQTSVRIQFTDARGEPARNQSLRLTTAATPIRTDDDGTATLAVTGTTAAAEQPLYPGLGALHYRKVRPDGEGYLRGLPGGLIQGMAAPDGTWYFPLREFLTKASPAAFAGSDRLRWHGDTRSVELPGALLLMDSGHVLSPATGAVIGRVQPLVVSDRLYLDLPALALLYQRWQWAAVDAGGVLRISTPGLPAAVGPATSQRGAADGDAIEIR